MTAIWYDETCDQIWIEDQPLPFAPRSLIALRSGDKIGVRAKERSTNIVWTDFGEITDRAGSAFLSADDAEAYLVATFARRPSLDIPSATAVAAEDIPAGSPAAVSRLDGMLRIARADTYSLAFVAGLAAEPIPSGMSGTATRNALTLPDWSAVAGTVSLNIGQPYFLGPEGGLTAVPNLIPGQCSVRVGNATGPQTLAPIQADPVLL